MIKTKHITYLSKCDKVLEGIIKQSNIPTINKSNDYLLDLYKYIIFQQISTKAGYSIFKRFLDYHKKNHNDITSWNDKEWKNIGLSHQKKNYIENIYRKKKEINDLKKISDNKKIRKELIKIKGIGNWTIDMFLIFSKGCLDIFPEGDLALIKVIKDKYRVNSINDIKIIANKWTPYKSIATLYLWNSLDDDFPS